MGFLRRIAGILGFLKDDAHEANDEEDDTDDHRNRSDKSESRRPTRGFSVQAPTAVDRTRLGPVLTPCKPGEGGIQGLRWYARRLRIDEDGDVADEFLNEVITDTSTSMDDRRPLPRFELKYSTRPAKVRNQFVGVDGKFHLGVEYQGRLQWV